MLRHTFPTPNRLSLAILTIALGIGIDGIPVALAQGASLEEVIVTARKRDENLMDIPESVSAIGAVEVERRNIKGLNKIGLAVPNLNLSMRTDGYPNVTIRGVGAYGMTQGVGFYLDECNSSATPPLVLAISSEYRFLRVLKAFCMAAAISAAPSNMSVRRPLPKH